MGKATPEHAALLSVARSSRLGMDGYARILAYLRPNGSTTAEVAKAFVINHNTATKVLRHMHRLKLIHRENWVRLVAHGSMVPVWRLGEHGDTAEPLGIKPSKSAPNPMLISLATVIHLLQEQPMTIGELADELCVHKETADRMVTHLRDHGLSRIDGWARTINGLPVAQHGYMVKRDAPRPGPQDEKEARKRWRATHTAKRQHIRLIAATAGAAA